MIIRCFYVGWVFIGQFAVSDAAAIEETVESQTGMTPAFSIQYDSLTGS